MKDGWPIKRLGDLSELITKGTTPTSVGHAFVLEGINFVKVESISEHGQFIESKLAHISQECHESLRRSQLKVGDILFSIAGALGRTAFVTNAILPANTNQALAIVRLKKSREVLPEFVLTALATGIVLEQIEKFKGGVAQQNLSLAQVQQFTIPLPPFLEQQRIVGILDEAFEGIATAKANAEKNFQNARAIFESHLESVFTQRGAGWVEKRLDQIGVTQTGSTPKTSERENYGDFIPFIKPADFNTDGSLDYDHDGLTENGLSKARKVAAGSVLMVCIGATIGKSGYSEYDVTTNQQINALTPFDGVSHKFIYYQMLTSSFQRSVLLSSGQATLPIINKSKWSALTVAVPPKLEEQQRIASELEDLCEGTQSLEAIYERKLAMLEVLKKSVLHRAFTGSL